MKLPSPIHCLYSFSLWNLCMFLRSTMGGMLPRNSDNLFSFSRRSSSSLGSCVDPMELTFDTRSLFDRSIRT